MVSGERELTDDLIADLLGMLPDPVKNLLIAMAESGGQLPLSTVSPDLRVALQLSVPSLVTFDREAAIVTFASAGMGDALIRAADGVAVREREGESTIDRIRHLLSSGAPDEALILFRREGGAFFAMVHGVHASELLIDQFPQDLRLTEETLVLASAVNALKSGNIARAIYLVRERFGAEGEKVLTGRLAPRDHTADLQCLRFIYAIYLDEAVSKRDLRRLFALLGKLPAEASIQRGLLYNAALDTFLRRRQWDIAAEAAQRALNHFERAGADLPCFYIELYLALINIVLGNLDEGTRKLGHAARRLASDVGLSSNDRRLLAAFRVIAAYETGTPKPLLEFALSDDPEARFGEIWPSVAAPIIAYGCLALATHATLAAARSFLDRWRLQEWRAGRFMQIVHLNEMVVLQQHRRWQEADEVLMRMAIDMGASPASDISHVRMSFFSQDEDIDLALAAARSALEWDVLDGKAFSTLTGLGEAAQATPRQRAQAYLWQAVHHLAAGQHDQRRMVLLKFFELISDRKLSAFLDENRLVLERAIGSRAARAQLMKSSQLARFVRQFSKPPAAANTGQEILTRQEERVLFLLAEGASNKLVARRLGVSVPTVRFHLKNIYRKLRVGKRSAAVEAAIRLGLLVA